MARFIILFIRYVAAIAVSWVVSFAMYIFTLCVSGSLLPDYLDASDYADHIGPSVVGFCGVFFGTLCLERASRRVGSIILLGLGLALGYLGDPKYLIIGPDPEDPLDFFSWLLPLSVGGLLAVALIFLIFRQQPPNTALEPTPTAP